MVKKCKVILNNDAVTVFQFDGIDIQVPSINRSAVTVNVKYDKGTYTVVPDDYTEAPVLKKEKKTTRKIEEETTDVVDEK